MSESSRSDSAPAHDPATSPDNDRDAKIEQLLLVGLDHYFATQYQEAINVWTRALFLDRSHRRARAYIERARSALAERQRQSEELLHHGVDAFHRGEGDEARRLLQAAIDSGAPADEAFAVLDRLNRFDGPSGAIGAARASAVPRRDRPRLPRLPIESSNAGSIGPMISAIVIALAIAAAGGYAAVSTSAVDWRGWLPFESSTERHSAPPPARDATLSLPSRGEVALSRARQSAASGHLREALAVLDGVRPTDVQRGEADRLRADIQRQMLALAPADRSESGAPMKCPKCGYLGFEDVNRCRNCGYDFSLTQPLDAALSGMSGMSGMSGLSGADGRTGIQESDLRIRPPASTPHPLDDLALVDAAAPRPSGQRFSDAGPDLDRVFGDSSEAESAAAGTALPLSGAAIPRGAVNDDTPLITRPSPPRPPLAVRRSTPDVPRLRVEAPRFAAMDLESEPPPTPLPNMESSAFSREAMSAAGTAAGKDADVRARVVAAAIDLVVLGAIDVVVVYFTLRICGMSMSELTQLPAVPLVAFLLVQNVGYLIAFTTGGQTLGKMAAGIRVVAADPDRVLDIGHATLRTLMWIALAIPAGLGFVSALTSRDHRGLHDRLAGTRVVR